MKRNWTKPDSYSTLSKFTLRRRRPRLRAISRILDSRPALSDNFIPL